MALRVALWLWSLDPPADRAAVLARHLSAEEEARAARFLKPRDAARYRAGRGRMREILGDWTDTDPAALRFGYTRFGRPFLAGGPEFNLSHSGGWAALAVAVRETAIGIDIEAFREVEHDVADRFFSPAERCALSALDPDRWADGFFRAWTRKEALVKAVGDGLNLPLADFDVTLAPGAPARLTASRTGALEPGDWTLLHLDLAPGFVGCIAVRAEGAEVTLDIREGALPLP